VHPTSGDLFFQRLLLLHQKGCTSFPNIRTVNGHEYETNRAAAEALGLLENDQEWCIAMEEAAATTSAAELRALFVRILVFCDVTTPLELFEKYWEPMSHDIPRVLSALFGIHLVHVNEPKLRSGLSYELEGALAQHGKSLEEFGIPGPTDELLSVLTNRSIMEEKSYDRSQLSRESVVLIPQLNSEQRQIFDIIMSSIQEHRQETIFVCGHGGTGKTFL
jgi:hypothetical protein